MLALRKAGKPAARCIGFFSVARVSGAKAGAKLAYVNPGFRNAHPGYGLAAPKRSEGGLSEN
jgi:hypothetical protein